MAMLDCVIEPSVASAAFADQIPQLTLENVQNIAQNDPYANSMLGGTLENNQGSTIETLVLDRVDLGTSLTIPDFTTSTAVCGKTGPAAKYGQTQFTAQLQTKRGESPLVCVKGARNTVANGYDLATQALKNGIKEIQTADNRAQLLIHSGLKYTALIGASIADGLNGGENQTDVEFIGGLPTAPMTFAAIRGLQDELLEVYNNVQMFDSGSNANLRVIVDSAQSEIFRNEAKVYSDFQAATTGSYNDAKNALWQYQFNPLYRGIKIGIDRRPLRFNEVDENNFPVYLQPFIPAAADHGDGKWVVNPAWRTALYSTGFIMGYGTFKRLVPKRYIDGERTFGGQFATGELQWINDDRISCNKYRDFGQYIWELERAIQPIVPHGVIPFNYKRCPANLGLAACPATDSVI